MRAPATPKDSGAAADTGSSGSRGRFVDVKLDDVTARARRSSPIGDETMRLQPNDRPISEPRLRFRPPEQVRAEPRLLDRPIDGMTRSAPVERHERLKPAPVEGTAPRAEPYREPPRQEPARAEPARVEPARPEPARVDPPAPRAEPAPSTKPTKND
jgi:hypothetical protein